MARVVHDAQGVLVLKVRAYLCTGNLALNRVDHMLTESTLARACSVYNRELGNTADLQECYNANTKIQG